MAVLLDLLYADPVVKQSVKSGATTRARRAARSVSTRLRDSGGSMPIEELALVPKAYSRFHAHAPQAIEIGLCDNTARVLLPLGRVCRRYPPSAREGPSCHLPGHSSAYRQFVPISNFL